MEALKTQTGIVPQRIQVDNSSEFISKDFDKWVYENKVTLDYSRPSKPTDNPFIESFNGSFRDECLNVHWFLSLEDAYEKINAWVKEYNSFRPHNSLQQMTPEEFMESYQQPIKKQEALGGRLFRKPGILQQKNMDQLHWKYLPSRRDFNPFSQPEISILAVSGIREGVI